MTRSPFNSRENFYGNGLGAEDRQLAEERAAAMRKEADALIAQGQNRNTLRLHTVFPCLDPSIKAPTTLKQGRQLGIVLRNAWLNRGNISAQIERQQTQIIGLLLSFGHKIARAIVGELSKAVDALSRSRWVFDFINDLRKAVNLALLRPAAYGYE